MCRALQDFYIDVSQSISRKPWTNEFGVTHALCTSAILYSFSMDTVLCGRERMQLHGHNKELFVDDKLSESTLKDLAGEGMAIPCLAGVLWCLYLTKQFALD